MKERSTQSDVYKRQHYTTRIRCGGNIRLSFGGVSFRARVLLDGNEIARHYGAFTAFETVVRRLPEGEHTLTVEVDLSLIHI